METVVTLALGLVLGFICGYLILHLVKSRAEIARAAEEAGRKMETDLLRQSLSSAEERLQQIKVEMEACKQQLQHAQAEQIRLEAANAGLQDKLAAQVVELDKMHQRLQVEFENIANRILDTKTAKFVDVNSDQLKNILDPLNRKINDFQQLVQNTYKNDVEGRTHLETVIREIQKTNMKISEEANHLASALKGQAKTQGGWGEMILQRIFEQSGLTEGREYRLQDFLKDEQGNPLRSESEGKKMQPDAVVMYPDDREVIIDAKVSLNAFLRFNECEDPVQQKQYASEHAQAVRAHVVSLGSKGYDDYRKSLDFVIMFIPNEAAFNLAMQTDPDLWTFAYDKKILLSSPLNLITSLKMFEDLWRRDDQSKNAAEIADMGAKLFDKFSGFVSSLEDVGKKLDGAKTSYDKAFSQMVSGKGNLIGQTRKLVQLGAKARKQIRYMSEDDDE